MVAQLLRLRLRLLANSFRRSGWHLVGIVFALLYGLGATVFAATVLTALRFADVDIASSIVVVSGSVVVLGYLLVPLAFGVDDAMDPRKFALFGIPTTKLSSGLAVAALISVPSIVLAVVAVSQVATWSRGGLPIFLAVVGAALILATGVLGARVTTSIAAFLLSSRRARDFTGIAALVVVLLLTPVFVLLVNVDWKDDGLDVLASVASVAGWTPIGAVWAAPADAAAGNTGDAIAKLLIAIAFVAVLWVAWRYLVGAMLRSPHRQETAKVYHGLGWFEWFPATSAGAIAARSLTYWARDSRYHVSLLIIPFVPVIMIVPLMVAEVPTNWLALIPVPFVALFLSWSIHNDVAYDNTAIWMHVASDVRGRADRFGRAVPVLLVGIPVVLIGAFICANLFGDIDVLPSLIGVSLCVLLSGLGLSSIMSARFPYPVVHPGDSPFAQPQTSGTASSLIQSVSFIATIVLSLPALAFAWLGLLEGGEWAWRSLWFGLGMGLFILAAGVIIGGQVMNRRSPEILAFSMRN